MEDFKVKPILLCGNAVEKLKQLEDCSVDCCVTSPPYYGLRDYGTGEWVGGDPNCDHLGEALQSEKCTLGGRAPEDTTNDKRAKSGMPFKSVCGKCGAIRVDEQIGLEETPEEYIARLVDVFREVRRVLKDDGTLWVNIGDSYASNGAKANNNGEGKSTMGWTGQKHDTLNKAAKMKLPKLQAGCKPKDLIGIPWMLAFALRADGWYLRQEIIWAKLNPMPESVTDRCTKSHESIFLLAKSQRYYFDAKAIAEPALYAGDNRGDRTDSRRGTSMNSISGVTGDTRNKRDVWTMSSQPFSGAHFATFPMQLPETCILAGSRIGGTVLDPFNGAGTTGIAAMNNGRNYVGIDLNAEYLEITRKRFTEEVQYATPLF